MDDIQEKLNEVGQKLDIVLEEIYAQKTHRKSMEDLNVKSVPNGHPFRFKLDAHYEINWTPFVF
jgi:hypothetical protein